MVIASGAMWEQANAHPTFWILRYSVDFAHPKTLVQTWKMSSWKKLHG
jgi:hypothetical protein